MDVEICEMLSFELSEDILLDIFYIMQSVYYSNSEFVTEKYPYIVNIVSGIYFTTQYTTYFNNTPPLVSSITH